jgi:exopolyphosphatase/guanosine-5'-triphosphate,3'-diphosphate pyrophosphatase
MELAEIGGGEVGRRVTSSLGPLALKEIQGGKKARRKLIAATLEQMAKEVDVKGKRLFLVGGSWRAFARLDMERRGYPLHVLHEYRITPRDAVTTAKWIPLFPETELCAMTGSSMSRMSLVPIASEIIRQMVRILRPRVIAVSSYGIREGMLYEQMPEPIRALDPLLEACDFFEKKDSRMPGFGDVLYDFVMPLFPRAAATRKRIIRAACLLHDVSWRAHPDYRAEVCFEVATRANLGGMKHYERVYLGVALIHRYKNSRENSPFSRFFSILDPPTMHEAEVLGKAMRLGSMFTVQNSALMGKLDWRPKKRILEMTLPAEARALFGEVAEARFLALAQALNAEPVVKIASA